ncbi:hypothetical protein JEZ13_12515 [bacterium]|nr:hypothetical protein [bacterium]
MKKAAKIKNNLGAVRKVQIMQGVYDGRYIPKVYEDKKKKFKNGYKKYKNRGEE